MTRRRELQVQAAAPGGRAARAVAGARAGYALVLLMALTPAPPDAGAGTATPALVEQKLRLLEGYFESAAASRIRDSGDADANAALSQARGLVVDARDALAGGDSERAAVAADEALRAFSAASRLVKRRAEPSGPQRTRYAELREAIASFRAALGRTRDGAAAARPPGLDLDALDAEMQRADRLAGEGYFDRATALLAELYSNTMRAISEARGSETVVYRLEFQTPEDELAYERERFRGNELLLEMLERGGASDNAKRLAHGFAEQARAKRDAALATAQAGDVRGAIAALEEAGSLLGRALRTLGLPYAP